MGKVSFGKVLDCLCVTTRSTSSCFCMNYFEEINENEEFEKKPLIASQNGDGHGEVLRLKDVVSAKQTLAFQLKPKIVVLRVSMHCIGCARKVEKHVSKLEGVSSYKVDLESKMVVVIGDIIPCEVLQSVSKVKFAQLWNSQS
ncbi:protein SODIUM POTASSIUM ROOT DEFECTIVE 2 [Mercurialis annua]|uniref:protein SODIUM POTASSIUM ROOT DEFECTIVE 2 n=1 Tax=Mercurialis annua TaxID=3986 RepID=UPI002160311C|nr:protein SODIUM POTASSIUM ROOT DEFECTIVE 2 [Mercurialis annua]